MRSVPGLICGQVSSPTPHDVCRHRDVRLLMTLMSRLLLTIARGGPLLRARCVVHSFRDSDVRNEFNSSSLGRLVLGAGASSPSVHAIAWWPSQKTTRHPAAHVTRRMECCCSFGSIGAPPTPKQSSSEWRACPVYPHVLNEHGIPHK